MMRTTDEIRADLQAADKRLQEQLAEMVQQLADSTNNFAFKMQCSAAKGQIEA